MTKALIKKYLNESTFLTQSLDVNNILLLKKKILFSKKKVEEFLFLEMVVAYPQPIILLLT